MIYRGKHIGIIIRYCLIKKIWIQNTTISYISLKGSDKYDNLELCYAGGVEIDILNYKSLYYLQIRNRSRHKSVKYSTFMKNFKKHNK